MREQKLSGAYKLADNRPTSPVDAHAHATRRGCDARAHTWFTALSPLWYNATCLLSNIHAPLNKLPDYLRNEVFKDRSFRCHFLISIHKPVSCTLSALHAAGALNVVHEMVHAPDEEIRWGRCQTPPGLNIYSATVRKHKYWPPDGICQCC